MDERLIGGHVSVFGAGVAGKIDSVTPDGVSDTFGIGFFGPVRADDAKKGRILLG